MLIVWSSSLTSLTRDPCQVSGSASGRVQVSSVDKGFSCRRTAGKMLSSLHYQSKNFTLEVVTFFPASLLLQYLSVSI